MDENKIIVVDDQGKELEMTILFTFRDDKRKKDYVVYYNPKDEDGDTYASIYDNDGHLFPIESDDEWDMIEEVLASFVEESENGLDLLKGGN